VAKSDKAESSAPLPSINLHLKMLILAAPIIATQYSLVLMQFIDAWMLGTIGSNELAAVTPAGLLIQVLVSFGAGFLTAVVTLVANALGRGEPLVCRSYGKQGVLIAAVGGTGCIALWPVAPSIFQAMGHSPAVMNFETVYFQVSLISVAPQLIAIAAANFFIGIQRTGVAMIGSICGMVANVVCNYALIFGAFGVPKLGFVGAAWGTVAASCLQAIIMLVLMVVWDRKQFCRDTSKLSWRPITTMGLPAAIQGAIDILSWGVVLTMLIGSFGTAHLAAATILIRCMQISFLPSDGLAAALQTMVGESLGRKRAPEARNITNIGLRLIVGYMVGMGVAFYFLRTHIMHFFSDDPAVVEIGIKAMVFVSFFQLFDAFNVTFINALHGAGDTLWPMLMNAFLSVAILWLGGSAVIHYQPHLASYGVWLVASIYIFAQGACFYVRWHSQVLRHC